MIIDLHPSECSIAMTLAVMRNATARGNKVEDKQMGDDDPIRIDYVGILAEIATARAFNCYPDLSVYPRKGGADLTTKYGKTVDVKGTERKDGNLLIHKDKHATAVDLYVLTTVDLDDRKANVVGWIYATDCIKEERLRNMGHGVGYFIHRNELKPI